MNLTQWFVWSLLDIGDDDSCINEVFCAMEINISLKKSIWIGLYFLDQEGVKERLFSGTLMLLIELYNNNCGQNCN